MQEKYLLVKEKLKKYGQEQLLTKYQDFDEMTKEKFLEDVINTDFEQILELYKGIDTFQNKKENIIEPIKYIEKSELSEKESTFYKSIGEKIIKDGHYAVVTMAGGQGTRLGHSGPKGTFDIGLESHKSIFEILCDSIKRASKEYGSNISWYIMTSKENNKETIDFFESNSYFNYPKENIIFFIQGELPMIDENGKIILNENGFIKKASNGHGGIFAAIRNGAIWENMQNKGIKWIFICGVDNILVNMVDPVLVGLSIEKKVLAAGKSVAKIAPEEKVGVFCKKNGKPSVIEYTEISKEMSKEKNENGDLKYGESHILCNLFNIQAIDKLSTDKLPYHCAHKKANYMDENKNIIIAKEPNAYKFEAFLFDAFESLDDMVIMRVKREDEFAPIKNADGVDSPQTAKELYKKFYKI